MPLRPELAALLLLAGALNLWALGRNGFANEYYSAAVRSMSSSRHAFLYGAFVRAGRIRWVLTDGGGGCGNDGRVGSTTAMAAVARTCRPVSSVRGLYDCRGRAGALARAP